MTPTRVSIVSVGVALLALLVVGLTQLHSSSSAPAKPVRLSLSQMRAELAGSPAALSALHAQAGALLPGGLPAVRARLAALRGHPVVINKWASWCVPCRAEFGAFQRVSLARGREVAFIGIDAGESSRADALAFLRSFPVSYPSYYDQSFWLNDPWQYRLPPAYGPYRWVRYWDDALLVNIYTGQVEDVLHNFFW